MKTIKNLISLGALAIFFVSSTVALAYVPGVWEPQPRNPNMEPGFTKVPMPKDEPVVIQTTPASMTTTQVAPIKTVTITPVKKTTVVASNTQVNYVPANTTTVYDQNNPNYPYNTYNNGLGAAAASSGSFMPDTIFEWILVILLILAVIILIRRLGRPADHEVHVVTGH